MKYQLINAVGALDEDMVESVAVLRMRGNQAHIRRLRPGLLIACLAVLFVLSTGCIAIAADAGGIQSWFVGRWEILTGNSMSTEHAAQIDHLSQKIGISRTVGDVTVTVDSATVGNDVLYLLLTINGRKFSDRHSYDFERVELGLNPDPIDIYRAFAGYGVNYLGVNGAGDAMLLLDYEFVSEQDFRDANGPVQVDLHLEDLLRNAHTKKEKSLCTGTWEFSFALDFDRDFEVVTLPDTMAAEDGVIYALSDIRISCTGIRFRHELDEDMNHIFCDSIMAILRDGSMISCVNGAGQPTDDQRMEMTYKWQVPLAVGEIASVKIGGTIVPIEK